MEQILKTSKENKPEGTVISKSGFVIGNGNLSFIAGPCAVESYETTLEIAKEVKSAGATLFRAGAFKPRTSPFTFQGLGKEGVEILTAVSRKVNIPTVSEITDPRQLEMFEDIDFLQVGARNMQNYELLKELGCTDKPILLKRGMSATISEFLMSAEYIMSGGNENIILCERGIRTFEHDMRNTFDVGAISLLKSMTHLPVIGDPSHAAGLSQFVEPLALAAVVAGADGIMAEVHICPEKSVSDSEQALTPSQLKAIIEKSNAIKNIL